MYVYYRLRFPPFSSVLSCLSNWRNWFSVDPTRSCCLTMLGTRLVFIVSLHAGAPRTGRRDGLMARGLGVGTI